MSAARTSFLRRPGPWFWLALLVGALLRAALLLGTEGTFDVAIKLHHGNQVNRVGLLEWYRLAEVMNHPPLMGHFFALAQRVAVISGLPFAAVLRAPFALLDLVTAGLVLLAFAGSPWRYLACAAYWLHPLAVLFSAYHGNTDSALAAFALASLCCVARGRAALAGAALGAGLWVKLPILVAAPALALALTGWSQRARFVAAAALVGVAGYLPALAQAPLLLVERIGGYGGSPLETPAGDFVWGLVHVLRIGDTGFARLLAEHNALLCVLPILLLAWWRRDDASAQGAGVTVCGSFLLLYGLTSFWAWQYLAWSLPFWLFLDARVCAALSAVVGGYVYGAYAFLTGSLVLAGAWDIAGHAPWPLWLTLLRDASVLLCLAVGGTLLLRAGLTAARAGRGAPA